MSTRVPLSLEEFQNPEWAEQGIEAPVIRLVAPVVFATPEGAFTEERYAIVDTGAPLSLLPCGLWQRCTVDLMGTDEIRGVVPRPECRLPAHIGKVTCYLADAERNPVPVELIAYLASIDNIALLLGFQGILEQFHLNVNHSQRMAYLER